MELVPSDKERGLQTPVWTEYESILHRAGCTVSLQPQLWGKGQGPSVSWRLSGSQRQSPKLCPQAVSHPSP